jgi:hypothetical protein
MCSDESRKWADAEPGEFNCLPKYNVVKEEELDWQYHCWEKQKLGGLSFKEKKKQDVTQVENYGLKFVKKF